MTGNRESRTKAENREDLVGDGTADTSPKGPKEADQQRRTPATEEGCAETSNETSERTIELEKTREVVTQSLEEESAGTKNKNDFGAYLGEDEREPPDLEASRQIVTRMNRKEPALGENRGGTMYKAGGARATNEAFDQAAKPEDIQVTGQNRLIQALEADPIETMNWSDFGASPVENE